MMIFSFPVLGQATKPTFILKPQNRIDFLKQMQNEGGFQNNEQLQEDLKRVRHFHFDHLGEMPGQKDLFPSFQHKMGLFDLLEAGLPYSRGDKRRGSRYPTSESLFERWDILLRNMHLTYEKDWKEAFPFAKPVLELILQIEFNCKELANHWLMINSLAKYLEIYNLKTSIIEQKACRIEKNRVIGYKLVVLPSPAPFHQHWAGILAEKLAQQPAPASVSFVSQLIDPRIAADPNAPHQLTLEIPALNAIDPYAAHFTVEGLLYQNQQLQYRKSAEWESAWPRHFLRRRQGSTPESESARALNSTVRGIYHQKTGYAIETIGALLEETLYLQALLQNGIESADVYGEAQTNLLKAQHLADHARRSYEHALDLALQNQLQFEYLGSGSLYDKFRIPLNDLDVIELHSPKRADKNSTDRSSQVLRELVLGYSWIADHSDLLFGGLDRENWAQRFLACHPLFKE